MNKPDSRPKVAVSSCLMGEEVRYDGGHKHNRYVTNVLSDWIDLVPFCPEVAVGLGIPRPTIRLETDADNVTDPDRVVRAIMTDRAEGNDKDFTQPIADYGKKIAGQINGFSGYILKKDSPSCGMERVKVYRGDDRPPVRDGVGIFAAEIMRACPNLPVEEEGRLLDPPLRENFIERLFFYHRWQQFMAAGPDAKGLVAFHTAHKFALLAHDEPTYREAGRLVASAGSEDIETICEAYISLVTGGLKKLVTPASNANVLMHIMGFFKSELSSTDKQELLKLIDDHRNGLVPVIVPITLINYFRRRFPTPYIDGQTYLEPHPPELMLRNTL